MHKKRGITSKLLCYKANVSDCLLSFVGQKHMLFLLGLIAKARSRGELIITLVDIAFDPFSPFPLGISWYIQGGKEIMVHYFRITDRYFVSTLYQVLRVLNNVLKLKKVR